MSELNGAYIELKNVGIHLNDIIMPLIITLLSIIILLLIRKPSFRLINKWSHESGLNFSEVILSSIKTPSIQWCFAIGLYLGISISEIPEKYLFYINKLIVVVIIFSVTLAIANLASRIIQYHIQKSNLSFPATGLIFSVLGAAILATGFLLILSTLGISITPIITALGIGGLAIALALKDTLSNIFSGIHILLEKLIRIGDFVRLESGQEGCVDDLTWRTARIKTISNNMVIIPNSKLSQSIVINYSLPETKIYIQIPASVSYSSDIEKVEKILLDVAKKAVGEVQGFSTCCKIYSGILGEFARF